MSVTTPRTATWTAASRGVRARAGRHPRRRELAGARLRLRRRDARGSSRPPRGAYVTDVDGNEYVDLVGSWGPALLGHAHPEVVEAVQRGGRARPELRRADDDGGRARRRDPLPRPAGREGPPGLHRHRGDDDGAAPGARVHGPRPRREVRRLLPRARRRAAGLGRVGRRDARAARTRPACPPRSPPRRSSLPVQRRRRRRGGVREHGDRIAAVITEAAPANMGVVPPLPGLQRARCAASRITHGALLIQDEVLTGFRVGYSGWWGLEGLREGGRPTCSRSARSSAAGCPVAAVGGRRDVMDAARPASAPSTRRARCRGTRWRPPPAWRRCGSRTRRSYARVDAVVGAPARVSSRPHCRPRGVPHAVQWAGNLFSIVFGAEAAAHGARDYAAVLGTEYWRYAPFFHALLDVRGATRRRRRSRRGSSRPRTTTTPSTGSSTRSRRRRAAARPTRRPVRRSPAALGGEAPGSHLCVHGRPARFSARCVAHRDPTGRLSPNPHSVATVRH